MQSRRLPALLAVIEHLEGRLYGGTKSDEDVLSDKELLNFLQSIGHQYAQAIISAMSNNAEPQRLKLEDELQSLLITQSKRRILSIRHIAILQLTEVIFRFISATRDVHSHVYIALQGLQIGFARTLLYDAGSLVSPDQPYRNFLEFLIASFIGYDQYSGRRARSLVNEIAKRVAEMLIAPNELEACIAARQNFAELLARYNRESSIYEKSLITKEQGLAARDDVRLLVNQEILKAIGGKSLPPNLLKFLKEVWSKYLQVIYLRDGKNSEIWQEGINVIQTLVRSLYIQDPYEMLQFYQEDLAQALAILHSGAESIHQDLQLTRNVLTYLDDLPLQLIQKGIKPDMSSFQEVPLADQSEQANISIINPEDVTVLDNFNIGDWCLINNGEQKIRGKLIQKDLNLGYCLFANFSGIKAARLEINGLVQTINNGALIRLDTTSVLERALDTALKQLENQVQRLETKVHVVEQERIKTKQATKIISTPVELASVATKVVTSKPTLIAEDDSHIKQLREKIRLEEMAALEQERKAAEVQEKARELAQRQEQEKSLEKALREANMLQPGGWLELIAKDNVKHLCKLGLKLKSTQKMIFVDKFGQKVAEMRAAELAARIVEGSARVIDQGVAFEDTLQSLILDRSGKINAE
jgi:hypothetical protein